MRNLRQRSIFVEFVKSKFRFLRDKSITNAAKMFTKLKKKMVNKVRLMIRLCEFTQNFPDLLRKIITNLSLQKPVLMCYVTLT